MSYVALYRTWRPQDFDALVGQDHIKTALTNALEMGKIAHAYLFTGPRGTGKTSTARILAKALNCEKGPTAHPCNACENCKQITEGSSMDVIEIDAASNRGIDEIRQLRERVAFAPVNSRYKVYIIDEVHMITTDAFNALLKTLEEPPDHVVFILATTEPHKIPATIHSRCQRYDFRRVTVDDIADHLKKVAQGSGIEADNDALRLMAIQADGGMRDAVSLLDQCGVMDKHVTAQTVRQVLGIVGRESLRQLVTLIGKKDLSGALEGLNELSAQGKDVKQVLLEVTEYLRALLLYKTKIKYDDIYLTDTGDAFAKIAPLYTQERILAATKRLHEALEELRFSSRGKIVAELCLFDLCHISGDTIEALAARVAELEKQINSGVQPVAKVTHTAKAPTPPHQVSVKQAPITPGESVKATPPVQVAQTDSSGFEDFGSSEPQETEPQEAASGSPMGNTSEGEELWQAVCTGLTQRKKRTVIAYAHMAAVISYDDNGLTLGVSSPSAQEKLASSEYKNLMEAIIEETTGKKIALHFEVKKDIQPQAAKLTVKSEPVLKTKAQTQTEELSAFAKKAQAVFGGKIKKE